jgi:hypothetical protein
VGNENVLAYIIDGMPPAIVVLVVIDIIARERDLTRARVELFASPYGVASSVWWG